MFLNANLSMFLLLFEPAHALIVAANPPEPKYTSSFVYHGDVA